MNAMNLKLVHHELKVYIPVYMYICQLPKIIKLHSLLFEIHTVLYHMKKFCQHIFSIKNDCLFTIFKIQYTLDVIF